MGRPTHSRSTLKQRDALLSPSDNKFTLHVATVNGSGSQTANTTLLRAVFQMGVPVSGKNLFPSNIAGLPTWFTIRVNDEGYVARDTRYDALVAINPETSLADVAAMGPGSVILLAEGAPAPKILAERAVYAGVTYVSWYPITPSSSLAEQLEMFLARYRRDPKSGKATYAVVQAEDEIAAIGMVLGASWAGARAMTTTSGPGLSLMTEFTGYAYYAEIPAVIWDIQRIGPSTGLPTRTSQADLLSVAFLSHGDTKHVMLFPATVEECFEFGWRAFDLAERLQTPVFVLSDLDLGMNVWMSDPFRYPAKPWDRGKVLDAADLTRIGSFERYKDIDGDAIPYRTLPGTAHPLAGYFTR